MPLAAVLDERILLGERAEVDALAEIVHRLEVLAPAPIDGLEDDVALDLARELRAERLLALVVRLERVLHELLRERVAIGHVELLAQLLDRDVGSVERLHARHEAVEIPVLRELGVRDCVTPASTTSRIHSRTSSERSSPSSTRRRCS